MVTLIGVILVVVGLSDFVAAAVIQMLQLRMIGLATVVIGAVLVAVGLAS